MMHPLILILIIAIALTVPLLIGIYVYKDAKSRGMNAKRATLLAVLAPSLIGFIIYLLTRRERMERVCPSCSAPAQDDWKVCPRCATPLPEIKREAATNNYVSEKAVYRILALVFIVPILIIFIAAFAIEFIPDNSEKALSIQMFTIDEYIERAESEASVEWLESVIEKGDDVCVLKYKTKVEDKDQIRICYLAYIPMLSDEPIMAKDIIEKTFSDSIDIGFQDNGEASGSIVVLINYRAAKEPKLNLLFGGEPLEYEMTEADEPIELKDIRMISINE